MPSAATRSRLLLAMLLAVLYVISLGAVVRMVRAAFDSHRALAVLGVSVAAITLLMIGATITGNNHQVSRASRLGVLFLVGSAAHLMYLFIAAMVAVTGVL